MNRMLLIILSLILAMAVGLGGCITVNPPEETEDAIEPAPVETVPDPEPWSPDRDHILVVPREYLEREDGCTINVPPADYRIIPISVGKYEHLAGWGWNAKGIAEDHIDSWLVNSTGGKVSESGRTFNYSCTYTVSGSPGLPPGTWYIYLSNEFTSSSAKAVTLRVRWN